MVGHFDLSTPPLLHTDMQENLRLDNADIVYESSTSFMIKLRSANICMLSSFDPKEAEALLDSLPEDPERFITVRGPYLKKEALKRGYGSGPDTDCYQYVYASKDLLPLKGTLTFAKPEPGDFDRVKSVYHLLPDDELYHDMYHGRFLKGIDRDGNFACFIGTHIESSMGLLYVFEEYRHKGYAEEIQSFLMNTLLNEGATPYCQVYATNTASMRLQEKLGLRRAEQPLIWLSTGLQ